MFWLFKRNDFNQNDFHARQQDGATLRFTSVDSLAEKYYSWRPYVYCANNSLKFIDPTGMWLKAANNSFVTYSKEAGWSNNAPSDLQKIGNAMMKTDIGTEQFNKLQESTTGYTFFNRLGDKFLQFDN